MAKVTGPLLSFGARGRVAKLVNYQRWKGRAYAKAFVKALDPRTAPQALSRDTFATADTIWTGSPDLLKAPFNRHATGQVKSGYNVWQGLYIRNNLGQTNLSRTVFSPGAKGGFATDNITIVAGLGSLTVTFVNPPAPSGWVLESAIAAALRDGDPRSTTFTTVTSVQDEVGQTTVVLNGLTGGVPYVVGAWLRWRKPDGSIAYGPSINGTGTPAAAFIANAVHFDGVNDWLARGAPLTGAVDGENILMSAWFKIDDPANDGSVLVIQVANGEKVSFVKLATDKLQIRLISPAFVLYEANSNGLFNSTTNTGWHNLLVTAQLDLTPSVSVYLDDDPTAFTVAVGPNQGDIDFTTADWGVGAFAAGTLKVTGDLAELYVIDEFFDLDVVANRRKFIDASNKPVDLGADGSTPTGSVPLMFFSGSTDAWHTNKGDGGGFTENGALTTAATSPSD